MVILGGAAKLDWDLPKSAVAAAAAAPPCVFGTFPRTPRILAGDCIDGLASIFADLFASAGSADDCFERLEAEGSRKLTRECRCLRLVRLDRFPTRALSFGEEALRSCI